jgi:hypothetical protein
MHLNQGSHPLWAPESQSDPNLPEINMNLSIFEKIKVRDDYPSYGGEKSLFVEKRMPSIITKLFIGGVPPCMDKDGLAD